MDHGPVEAVAAFPELNFWAIGRTETGAFSEVSDGACF